MTNSTDKMQTITLSQALADMGEAHFGPKPRAGWLAALSDEGKVFMVAGPAAEGMFYMNAGNRPVRRIVKAGAK